MAKPKTPCDGLDPNGGKVSQPDPLFNPKIGDLVDRSGRRIGTVHSLTPSPLGGCLIGAIIVALICGGAVAFANSAFHSVKNLFEYGHFVSNDQEAALLKNRNNPDR